MTATPTICREVLEDERNAEFRLSARQRDVLTTLNTLFDELSPAAVFEGESSSVTETCFNPADVSRTARD